MNSDMIINAIEKEEISTLHFPSDDVLFSKDDQISRNQNLYQALALGNLDHVKVRIYFNDVEGAKVVETTVWGVTDNQVILKRGSVIPINRITKVRLL